MAGPVETIWEFASAPELALAAAVGLGQVFAWSGTAKWVWPRETAQALVGFRVTKVPSRPAVTALAGGEVALAALLLVGVLVSPTLAGSALLMASLLSTGFVVTIAAALRRPNRFPCMCFGGLEAPLSSATLLRALLLLMVASVATATAFSIGEQPSAREWILWNVVSAGALSCLALGSRLAELLRFDDPFDFSGQALLDPTGLGPIAHDHD